MGRVFRGYFDEKSGFCFSVQQFSTVSTASSATDNASNGKKRYASIPYCILLYSTSPPTVWAGNSVERIDAMPDYWRRLCEETRAYSYDCWWDAR